MLGRVMLLSMMVAVASGCNAQFASSCVAPFVNQVNNVCGTLSWTTNPLCLCAAYNVTCNMENSCRSRCVADTRVDCPCDWSKFGHELTFTAEYYVGDQTLWSAAAFKEFFHLQVSPWLQGTWTTVTSTTDSIRPTSRVLTVSITIPHNTAVQSNVVTSVREMLQQFPALRQLSSRNMSLKSPVISGRGRDFSSSSGISTGAIIGIAVGCGALVVVIVVVFICCRATKEEEEELEAKKSQRLQSFRGSQSNIMSKSKSGKSFTRGSVRTENEDVEQKEVSGNPDENAPDMV